MTPRDLGVGAFGHSTSRFEGESRAGPRGTTPGGPRGEWNLGTAPRGLGVDGVGWGPQGTMLRGPKGGGWRASRHSARVLGRGGAGGLRQGASMSKGVAEPRRGGWASGHSSSWSEGGGGSQRLEVRERLNHDASRSGWGRGEPRGTGGWASRSLEVQGWLQAQCLEVQVGWGEGGFQGTTP